MGSGGSSSGLSAGKGSGGSRIEVVESDGRVWTVNVKNFSGNDGMVEAMDFGTTGMGAPENDRLDVTKYDFVISGDQGANGIGGVRGLYYNGDRVAGLSIGVKLATPQGVSVKQQNYAKSVLGRRLENVIADGFRAAFNGKTTVENAIQQVKKLPKMSAREILDRWR